MSQVLCHCATSGKIKGIWLAQLCRHQAFELWKAVSRNSEEKYGCLGSSQAYTGFKINFNICQAMGKGCNCTYIVNFENAVVSQLSNCPLKVTMVLCLLYHTVFKNEYKKTALNKQLKWDFPFCLCFTYRLFVGSM